MRRIATKWSPSPKHAAHPRPHVRDLRVLALAVEDTAQRACGEFGAQRRFRNLRSIGILQFGAGAAGADAGGGGDFAVGAGGDLPPDELVVLKVHPETVGPVRRAERARAAFGVGSNFGRATEGECGERLGAGSAERDRAGPASGRVEQPQPLGLDREGGLFLRDRRCCVGRRGCGGGLGRRGGDDRIHSG